MDKQIPINRSLFFSFGSGTAWYRALKIQHGRMSNQTRTFNTDSGSTNDVINLFGKMQYDSGTYSTYEELALVIVQPTDPQIISCRHPL